MTEENYNYRTSQLLLRNQFAGDGKLKIPIIPKASFSNAEFQDLLLIGFDRTNLENNNHLDRMVHFFLYDYKFERVWKNPDNDIEKLKRYRAVFSPDFSMYLEMSPVLQLYNTFRNRWCGAYFASKGMRVVPTVSWGDENTFDFCFEGIPKGSTVAVSTYMVSEHNNHSDQKEFFLKGYREMLQRVEPERIICYNDPFPEMQGEIVFVDYERSSWKYQNDRYIPSKYAKCLLGLEPIPKGSHMIIKQGFILPDRFVEMGMGRAAGGEWRPSPNKPDDKRFLGKPGEVIRSTQNGKKRIFDRDTKIGEDGRAICERHYTDHGSPLVHSNPHDHPINWSRGFPDLEKQINYPDEAPTFKYYKGENNMSNGIRIIESNTPEQNRFKTISEFKWSIDCGGEVVFIYNDRTYGVFPKQNRTPNSPDQFVISELCIEDIEATEKWYDTADELLEYEIEGKRLRDIITEVEVEERFI